MLDASECTFVSGAEANPLYKVAAMGVFTVIMGLGILNFQGYQAAISDGEKLEKWLKKNEAKVEEAGQRFASHQRIERAEKTLETWKETRHDYGSLLRFVGGRVPDPIDQTQFLALSFNEEMVGMRTKRKEPASGQTEFYPLERQITMNVTGLIKNDRPDLMLEQFKALLQLGEDGPPIENITMRLQSNRNRQFRDRNGEVQEGVTPFSAEFVLENRELKP